METAISSLEIVFHASKCDLDIKYLLDLVTNTVQHFVRGNNW